MSIEVKNLFYFYNPKSSIEVGALNNINLSIPNHSFSAIIGETGSGKTTLVQHFNGLYFPSTGEVKVDDFILTGKKKKYKRLKEIKKHVGLIFQFPEYQLFEETVLLDVAYGPKNFGLSEKESIEAAKKALNQVGIPESYYERSPFELSGGERRRVAIAGILAMEPDILVLDEPNAGLDPQGCKEIMQLVTDYYAKDKTVIIVTHDMNLVLEYCDNAYLLHEGKLIFQGSPYDLFKDYQDLVEVPPLYFFVNKLNNVGFDIPLRKIHFTDDLIPYVEKGRKK